jgi:hypothetical protein
MQNAPVLGGGVRECDGDGDGDLDGDGLALLVGLGLLDGLFDGLGLFDGVVVFVGLGLFDRLLPPVGLGVPDGVAGTLGLGVPGADGVLGLSVGVTPADEVAVAVAVGPLTESVAAWITWAAPEPQRLLGLAGAADAGAIAGPDSKNNPAPAATAACPTRTTLSGTAALR